MNRYEYKTVYGDGVQQYFSIDCESIDEAYVIATYRSTRELGARPDIASIEFVQVLVNDIRPSIGPAIERLKADLRYHQAERARLAEELSELDEPYSAETDTAESYAAGRVEALTNAIDILLGREVEMYSETGLGKALGAPRDPA